MELLTATLSKEAIMANGPKTSITDKNFIGGIDAMSPINDIPDGYVADSLNVSPNARGEMVGRPGTYTLNGLLPLRVERLIYTEEDSNNLIMFLEAGIDTSALVGHPILVLGRTSVQNTGNVGDFPRVVWTWKRFDTYRTNATLQVSGGSGQQLIDCDAFSWAGASRRVSFVDESSSVVVPFRSAYDTVNDQCEVTVEGAPDGEYFVYKREMEAEAGFVYHHTHQVTPSASEQTVNIPGSTHGCGGQVLVKCFIDLLDGDAVTDYFIEKQISVHVFVNQVWNISLYI
jgi:hypothetical protein